MEKLAFTNFSNKAVNGGVLQSAINSVVLADYYTIEHGINDWGHSTPVGTIDFLNFDPLNNRAELGLFIAAEHRGKGLGRQALELLTAYAREHLGLRQLYVFIALDNTVCLKMFEDYGYRRVGVIQSWVKRGSTYRDVAFLQMVL